MDSPPGHLVLMGLGELELNCVLSNDKGITPAQPNGPYDVVF